MENEKITRENARAYCDSILRRLNGNLKRQQMIKIELQFENGEQARGELIALFFGGKQVLPEIAIKDEKIAENFEAPKMEVVKDETAQEVSTGTKKRRTKAEIALEAAQPAIEEQLGETDIQSEEPAKEETKVAAVTKEMLQEKAVNLIRNSKKEQVVAVLKKFGADSIAQADKNPLKVEDYPAVMDELNKL